MKVAKSGREDAYPRTQPSSRFPLPPVASVASPAILVIHNLKGQRALLKRGGFPEHAFQFYGK